jgi:peptide/nickel transport system ATP-binding protein
MRRSLVRTGLELAMRLRRGVRDENALARRAAPRSPTGDLDEPLLRVEQLVVEYAVRGALVHAVSNVSFEVDNGETLGLVGETGCGKSTTGRSIICLPRPTSGSIVFEGVDLTKLGAQELRARRPRMQMIFQDPISSLNPRRSIADIVAEPLGIWQRDVPAGDVRRRVGEMLEAVGLDARWAGRKPSELSGGQCQRVSIARALILEPRLLVCDEPVSALDVSVQAKILNLLEEMKTRYGLTIVFISHDLRVVKSVCDRIVVMYLGKLCEFASGETIFAKPAHPYTAALIDSIPQPGPDTVPVPAPIVGDTPSAVDPPSGCRFRTRCPRADNRCAIEEPLMRSIGPNHDVACHHPIV